MFRTILIWLTGGAASVLFGMLVGTALLTHYGASDTGAVFGSIAGLLAFICARLWTAERRARFQAGVIYPP